MERAFRGAMLQSDCAQIMSEKNRETQTSKSHPKTILKKIKNNLLFQITATTVTTETNPTQPTRITVSTKKSYTLTKSNEHYLTGIYDMTGPDSQPDNSVSSWQAPSNASWQAPSILEDSDDNNTDSDNSDATWHAPSKATWQEPPNLLDFDTDYDTDNLPSDTDYSTTRSPDIWKPL